MIHSLTLSLRERIIRGAMHCYLFVVCKTPGCNWKHVLKHVERPIDDPGYVYVPAECFPLSLACKCGKTHSYTLPEVQTHSSLTPLHERDFRDVLPDMPTKLSDKN